MNSMEDEEQRNLTSFKQRPSRLNAKPIGAMVRKLMAQSGYGQVQAAEELSKQWEVAAGPTLARTTRPGNIARGVLLVHVADSSSLQELGLCKRQILQRLQKNYPQANIKNLRGRVTQF